MKDTQRGFNLISLMVGMALSLISILAMLTLYRNMVSVSVDSMQSARQDGQIAAALLTVQDELSNAGFRVPPATSAIKLLKSAALTNGTLSGTGVTSFSTEQTGNALVWMYRTATSASYQCAGLLAEEDRRYDPPPIRLVRLQTSTCTSLNQSTGWTATPLIERGQTMDFFKVVKAACWPYGKVVAPQRLQVSIMAQTSTVDTSNTAPYATVCLPNIAS
ncbi:PilW family protein [Pseudomonas ovata]|uniref:PilW family protein n=1 Tax=Pseudomonas ovata TaxID=1839709 RepID=UPI000D69500E|nr:hypothetical protein [Pseudomonas ovata]